VARDQGVAVAAPAGPALGRRGAVSAFFAPKRRTRLTLLLGPPLFWLVVAYLGAIAALLVSSLWSVDSFTGNTVHLYTTDNLHSAFTLPLYRTVAFRTIGIALAVTVIDALIAFPMAFYMSVVAGPKLRRFLVVAVLTPVWASYLVKAYAWRGMFSTDGVLNWMLKPIGAHGPGFGLTATIIVLAYLWLPFMILPIYAGLERLPDSLLEASGDLGASAVRTVRSVVLPLVFPSVVAGSIFTFSLSLGDYIAVQIVGGKNQLLGNLIQTNVGAANNLPLAAAIATVPVAVMVLYLLAVRRTGALDNL
jgi:putative spermidine/putrescine transport system permease protein